VAKTQEDVAKKDAVYSVTGTLLEACSCGTLCPCWIGEDPDQGDCLAFNAYHFDTGQIKGVDVSGLNLVNVVHIPGNVLQGNWKLVMFVDDRASAEQKDAIVSMFKGELGGPIADVVALVGEVLAIEDAPINADVVGGVGSISIPGILESKMEPYRGPDGTVTTLRDSIFSTVPGSPAWVSKAAKNKVNLPQYGMVWDFENRNAIQADWKMEHIA